MHARTHFEAFELAGLCAIMSSTSACDAPSLVAHSDAIFLNISIRCSGVKH